MVQEMSNRFSESSTEVLTCIACLDPKDSFSQFDIGKLLHLAELYPEDFSLTDRAILEDQLETYIQNVRGEFSMTKDLGSLAKKMVETGKNTIFPLVYRLIELALVLPVATASVERVFSAMKIIKTDLRNRMGDEWMNDSLVVYIEKDIFATIENEQILQHFQQMSTRRIQLPPLVCMSRSDAGGSNSRQDQFDGICENFLHLFWNLKMEDTGRINVNMMAGEYELFKEAKRRATSENQTTAL
ncbi:uncharacterized protein LOC122023161 [Zingiber officinale]|uniref:uncharacterized protein LOC122023161 n=1 Tax=Zingiber officinale TaxID=94328 RepID=UPI001C4C0087|nr:uncharacterized protein LOC122023161 [Zingiber officinale]